MMLPGEGKTNSPAKGKEREKKSKERGSGAKCMRK